MHNMDKSGEIIYEDTSGIYVSSSYTGSNSHLNIENINGYNSGKRLIKIDARNVSIAHVISETTENDQLSVIGVNNGIVNSGNIEISDVKISGVTNTGIALDGDGIHISNVNMNLSKGEWNDVFGFAIAGNNITIENVEVDAGRCVFFNSTNSNIENFLISNAIMTVKEYGTHTFHYNEPSYGFSNLKIHNVVSYYEANPLNPISFFQATGLDDSKNKRGIEFEMLNCKLYSSTEGEIGIRLHNVSDVKIESFKYNNDSNDKGVSAIVLEDNSIVNINQLLCNANVMYVISISNSNDIDITNITSLTGEDVIQIYNSESVDSENISNILE